MTRELTTSIGRQTLSLRDGAAVLFRRKWMVLLIFLTVVAGTIVLTRVLPDKYESHMKILVKNQRADLTITPANATNRVVSEGDVTENQINSEIELLTSRDLLTQIVNDCGLAKAKPGLFSKTPPTEAVRVERAVNQLSKDLNITPARKANIISVSYASNSPELSAKVLKRLGELYLEKHLKLHHPEGVTDFFQNKADEYETQLKETENRFAEFQKRNNLVTLEQQKDLTLSKTAEAKANLMASEAAVNEATQRIKRVEQQLAAMPERVLTQSRTLPNQYSAERLNTMMVELQTRRTQLLTKFKPDDRLVREVDEQIRITREALDKAEHKSAVEEATGLNPLRQTLETELARARLDQSAAMARRATLTGQLQEYQAALDQLEGNTTKHNDLQRELKEAEENYQLYSKKREESRIADELDRQKITNVSVAEAPVAAQLPTSPNRPLNLVLGIVLAGFLCVGSMISAELLDDTVHSARQLEAMTGGPVLATVPENGRKMLSQRTPSSRQMKVNRVRAELSA
ncbi:MAG TPA: Wzz/FepE/Etk N-terminal domain-containing protein [Pyrinomonadaceae bacterium]|jgi:uncharacterized protein involved in exopolysaccharide biosynthesis